jgi:3-methyl-2-oxobutanoate hydroxymethyltransferase
MLQSAFHGRIKGHYKANRAGGTASFGIAFLPGKRENPAPVKMTTQTFRALKGQRPIVCVTAYDTPMAHCADAAGVDLILVGDSVGNNVLGFANTVPVTLDMIVHHAAAVARAKPEALLVADLPFGDAHLKPGDVVKSCRRLLQEGGVEAVKIEGGAALAPLVARLVLAGIPVMGHIGLQPQQINVLGGYRKFGQRGSEAETLRADAAALENAGAFALVAELVEPRLAAELSRAARIPVIGIGSGPDCDGQILVAHDILGLTERAPAFAKAYANLHEVMRAAFTAYAGEVRARVFPAAPAPAKPVSPSSE